MSAFLHGVEKVWWREATEVGTVEDFCRRQHRQRSLQQGVPRYPRRERKTKASGLDEESGQVSPHIHKATAAEP